MQRFTHRTLTTIALALAASGVAFSAQADVISYQNGVNGYAGSDDTGIYSGSLAARNLGGSSTLNVGVAASGTSERRVLYRFDISSFAGQYDSIQSAQLHLTRSSTSGGGSDFTLGLYQIADANAGWGEGVSNFTNANDGEATWRAKSEDIDTPANRVSWAGSAGLGTAGTDYVATPLDTQLVATTDGVGTVISFDLTPALIEQWATGVNAGLLLTLPDLSTDVQGQFYASEWGGSEASAAQIDLRPELIIEFTPVPEPGSLALMGLGTALLVVRQRKTQA